MSVLIREFQPKDEAEIINLMTELVRDEATRNPIRISEPNPLYAQNFLNEIKELIHKGQGILVIAADNEVIVGYGFGYLKEQTPDDLYEYKPLRIGYLEDLFVVNMYRGMGVGQELLSEIESFFKDIKCNCYQLSVGLKNTSAINLYKKLGFQENLVEMIKFV